MTRESAKEGAQGIGQSIGQSIGHGIGLARAEIFADESDGFVILWAQNF